MKTVLKIVLIIAVISCMAFAIYWLLIRTIVAKSDFKNTIKCLNESDFTEDFYYANSEGEVKEYLESGKAGYLLLQKSEFKVMDYDFHWNSKIAEVTVEVQFPDLILALNDKFDSADVLYSSDKLSEIMVEALESPNLPYTADSLQISIVQDGWHWYVMENDALRNVYSGGMYNELKERIET